MRYASNRPCRNLATRPGEVLSTSSSWSQNEGLAVALAKTVVGFGNLGLARRCLTPGFQPPGGCNHPGRTPSVNGADHLLSKGADAIDVADVSGARSQRYLPVGG